MTGPEHREQAERLLRRYYADGDPGWAAEWGPQTLAAAQVHATLALAAAVSEATS